MLNHKRLAPARLADDDPNAIEMVSLWVSSDGTQTGMSLLPDIFTDAEDWGYLMAYILINAVSAQKHLFDIDEKEYCRRAIAGLREKIEEIGLVLEGGGYDDIDSTIDNLGRVG
jgi:hypothetical protein